MPNQSTMLPKSWCDLYTGLVDLLRVACNTSTETTSREEVIGLLRAVLGVAEASVPRNVDISRDPIRDKMLARVLDLEHALRRVSAWHDSLQDRLNNITETCSVDLGALQSIAADALRIEPRTRVTCSEKLVARERDTSLDARVLRLEAAVRHDVEAQGQTRAELDTCLSQCASTSKRGEESELRSMLQRLGTQHGVTPQQRWAPEAPWYVRNLTTYKIHSVEKEYTTDNGIRMYRFMCKLNKRVDQTEYVDWFACIETLTSRDTAAILCGDCFPGRFKEK